MNEPEQTEDMQNELDEALLGLEELIVENPEEALSTFETLPEIVQARPEFQLTLARANQAVEQLEAARDIVQDVIKLGLSGQLLGDAYHLLGDIVEDLGDSDAANGFFLKTLSIDQEAYDEGQSFEPAELTTRLNSLAEQAIAAVGAEGKKVKKQKIEKFPEVEDVKTGLDPRAFTAFDESGTLTLYSANIDAEFGDLEEFGEFDEHVLQALGDQLAYHLGLPPAEL